MIDFSLGPELELLRETARRFAAEQLWPEHRSHEKNRALCAEARSHFEATALETLELPLDLGGGGLGTLARTVLLEELAAADPGAALALDRLGAAVYPLAELGGDAVLRELALPLLEDPEARAVLVWNGRGELVSNGDTVSGTVAWVAADRADLVVVLDADGAAALREGVSLELLRGAGLRSAGASSLTLESAPVTHVWRDLRGARRALARARLYVAALLVGVMRVAAEYSRTYAMDRVAFGRPIAHHQALAFLIADMATAVDGARLSVQAAASTLDRGDDATAAASMAFSEAIEQSMFVTPNALQILGGHGFMQDHPVEKFMRDARALGLLLGGIDAAREDAGALLTSVGPGSASWI